MEKMMFSKFVHCVILGSGGLSTTRVIQEVVVLFKIAKGSWWWREALHVCNDTIFWCIRQILRSWEQCVSNRRIKTQFCYLWESCDPNILPDYSLLQFPHLEPEVTQWLSHEICGDSVMTIWRIQNIAKNLGYNKDFVGSLDELPSDSEGVKSLLTMQETWVQFCWEDPEKGEWPPPSILAGRIPWQRSLAVCCFHYYYLYYYFLTTVMNNLKMLIFIATVSIHFLKCFLFHRKKTNYY